MLPLGTHLKDKGFAFANPSIRAHVQLSFELDQIKRSRSKNHVKAFMALLWYDKIICKCLIELIKGKDSHFINGVPKRGISFTNQGITRVYR